MMPSSGPPTPEGVGGPTPPLVSRGSEEERKTKIPTWGPPTSNGVGGPTSPPTKGERGACPYFRGERGASYPKGEREGREEGGGEPAGQIKKIDTTVLHEPGTTHVRSKREPPPQKG